MCSGRRGAPFSCMPPQGGVASVYPSILANCLSHRSHRNRSTANAAIYTATSYLHLRNSILQISLLCSDARECAQCSAHQWTHPTK